MNSATVAVQRPPSTSPIALGDVPILRSSHQRIGELSQRQSTALSHLQRLIEGDPGVALNLFTDVNKKLKGGGRAPAADIPRAVVFMDPDIFIRRIAQAPVLETLANDDQVHGLRRLLGRAHHASRQARTIGRLLGGISGDELLAASLTREALAYVEALSELPGSSFDPGALRGLLPAPLDGHDVERVSNCCIDLAARFATATDAAWDEAMLDPILEEVADLTRQSPEDVASAVKSATVDAARDGEQFEIYPAAIYLMSPGPRREHAGSRSQLAKPIAILRGTHPKKRSAAAPQQAPSAMVDPASKGTTNDLDRVLKRLQHAAKNGKSAAKILPFSLQMICEHVDVQLAVLLTCDERSGQLAVRLHHGLRLPDQLIGHSIDP